jgi:hypothetical protein
VRLWADLDGSATLSVQVVFVRSVGSVETAEPSDAVRWPLVQQGRGAVAISMALAEELADVRGVTPPGIVTQIEHRTTAGE